MERFRLRYHVVNGPSSSLWIVERGVGAVVKWSCGVMERCVNMSVSQHFFWVAQNQFFLASIAARFLETFLIKHHFLSRLWRVHL